MNRLFAIIFPLLLISMIILIPITHVDASNESSFQYGYMSGSLKSPQIDTNANYFPQLDNNTCGLSNSSVLSNGAIMPAVTNQTACQNGFFAGWKNWCLDHAVNCVRNITSGYLPDLLLKTHQQYQRGYTTSNGTYNQCPIGENNAYCIGWYDNIGDRAGECGDNPNNGTFASHDLLGCPLDVMTSNQMAKPHAMIGTWDYVNGTFVGKIVFSDYGNFTLKIPSKTAFGDYKLEGSWGSLGHNLLTLCYPYAICLNNTLTAITPNHIEFRDSNGNMIHLMKPATTDQYLQNVKPETGATIKLTDNYNYNRVNPLGTWSINESKSTITFDSFIKYAHWKYSQYCCDVNIQKFVANIGHKYLQISEGYWNSSISPAYSDFPSSIGLCRYNIQDHGEYHDVGVKGPLSDCTIMTVYVFDNNHLDLHSPSGVMYLTRESG
jgi:hypothetical protein